MVTLERWDERRYGREEDLRREHLNKQTHNSEQKTTVNKHLLEYRSECKELDASGRALPVELCIVPYSLLKSAIHQITQVIRSLSPLRPTPSPTTTGHGLLEKKRQRKQKGRNEIGSGLKKLKKFRCHIARS